MSPVRISTWPSEGRRVPASGCRGHRNLLLACYTVPVHQRNALLVLFTHWYQVLSVIGEQSAISVHSLRNANDVNAAVLPESPAGSGRIPGGRSYSVLTFDLCTILSKESF